MNYHVCDVDGLVLHVRGSGDVREPKELFDGGKDGRDRFLRMVSNLPDNLLALKDFVRHQMTSVFL